MGATGIHESVPQLEYHACLGGQIATSAWKRLRHSIVEIRFGESHALHYSAPCTKPRAAALLNEPRTLLSASGGSGRTIFLSRTLRVPRATTAANAGINTTTCRKYLRRCHLLATACMADNRELVTRERHLPQGRTTMRSDKDQVIANAYPGHSGLISVPLQSGPKC